MAETQPPKRSREEEEEEQQQQQQQQQRESLSHQQSSLSNPNSNPKRHKPYCSNILANLHHDDHQDERPKDQIAPDPSLTSLHQKLSPTSQEEAQLESMIRHLLEASDDELGIPSKADPDTTNNHDDQVLLNSGENLGLDFEEYDRLWGIEDEAANYNAVSQSHLFM